MIVDYVNRLRIVSLVLAVSIFWVLVITGFVFIGGPVLDRSKLSVTVSGKTLDIKRQYRKLRDCRVISASYVLRGVMNDRSDDLIIPLNITLGMINQETGVSTTNLYRATVPETVPPGRYQVRANIAWQCNPLQTRAHTKYSNVVEIR